MFLDETPRCGESSDHSGPFSDGTPTHRDEAEGWASPTLWTPEVHRARFPREAPQTGEYLPLSEPGPDSLVNRHPTTPAESSPYSVVVYVSPSLTLGWEWLGVAVLAGFVLGFSLAETLLRLWAISG